MALSAASSKRFAVVIAGSAVALAIKDTDGLEKLPAFALLLSLVFWGMDARYHQQERWFRHLYDSICLEPQTQRPDFRMRPSAEGRDENGYWKSAFSWSVFPFHAAIAFFLVLAWSVL